ncbi:helix-hairpin-helix domain-containing protein [Alicyclobacillus ferrooxydans]|uniref:Uncharacterized protein n=1 Tax=Alicyclobacillus ferrooxydans TaxID=471514 RepID=A0A0P9ELB1_9BACL|nr:hypothetical protein AN477_23070 [Alicyclobacillus ferrooxydans]
MIPDIGPVMAECLVLLGYSHTIRLKGKDPVRLLDTPEERLGFWLDPCVEGQKTGLGSSFPHDELEEGVEKVVGSWRGLPSLARC